MRTALIFITILLALPATGQTLAKRRIQDSLSRRTLILEKEDDFKSRACYSIIDEITFYDDQSSFFAYYVFFKQEEKGRWVLIINLNGHRFDEGTLPEERFLRMIPLRELDFTKPEAILDTLEHDRSYWLREKETPRRKIEL